MNKSRLLVGNWKMYLDASRSVELARALAAKVPSFKQTSIWIAPSFPYLPAIAAEVRATSIQVGAQNVHWENEGAFTGEVSPAMLHESGCSFAITGHSERRSHGHESSEEVARRASCALVAGLSTIVCVGETLEQRTAAQTDDLLREQLAPLLKAVRPELVARLCIAYEPVWAIGTGRHATNDDIFAAHDCISKEFLRTFKEAPPILYGGSVAPDNFAGILAVPNVAGALVGRASLRADQFLALAEISENRA